MSLRSWSCAGCTNICFQVYEGKVAEYCRPMAEYGEHHKQWIGDMIVCLDYTTDPDATDPQVRLWRPPNERRGKNGNKRSHGVGH